MMMAEEMGCPHVDEMLNTLEPQQFDEWMAYYVIKHDIELTESNSIEQSLKTVRGMAGV